jgi:mono/diheme cytochrome c family protein
MQAMDTTATSRRRVAALVLAACGLLAGPAAQAATPAELLAGYTAQAGSPAQASRGQAFFTTTHGREWSCASCHGARPTGAGKHAGTGKPIAALAPAFNPSVSPTRPRWRSGSAATATTWPAAMHATEKADVLAWLLTLKP